MKNKLLVGAGLVFLIGCGKKDPGTTPLPPAPKPVLLKTITLNGTSFDGNTPYVSVIPEIRMQFSAPVLKSSATNAIVLTDNVSGAITLTTTFENDSLVLVKPSSPLKNLTRYSFSITPALQGSGGGALATTVTRLFSTGLDSSNKFPIISDNELLDKVQRVTFKYFWDFGHPTSGLARERNTSGDIVTSGGSGFGIMALIAATDRKFVTHADALARMQKMVDFLLNKAQKFHGAFPHWLNGNTGLVVPFSTRDDGADLVETAFLVQGLLAARQYFDDGGAAETALRADINKIWEAVEWDWFRKNNGDVLYWHWSPTYAWDMNLPIRGWNECLVVYALAASSPTHSIPKTVYDNGWASGGGIRNGNAYYGVTLPLGPAAGGPIFFAHYSFLGINPTGLTDAYADYWQQNRNHTLIHYNYALADPRGFGYSSKLWGLTANDISGGYSASSPTNDLGVVAPTAALSSMPYTPAESMQALKFYYYVLGDKIWKEDAYGFVDAFALKDVWFADSYLAIDQGPIIVMIENYRSGLLWKLFMSAPEVKKGMKSLGFSSPNL